MDKGAYETALFLLRLQTLRLQSPSTVSFRAHPCRITQEVSSEHLLLLPVSWERSESAQIARPTQAGDRRMYRAQINDSDVCSRISKQRESVQKRGCESFLYSHHGLFAASAFSSASVSVALPQSYPTSGHTGVCTLHLQCWACAVCVAVVPFFLPLITNSAHP